MSTGKPTAPHDLRTLLWKPFVGAGQVLASVGDEGSSWISAVVAFVKELITNLSNAINRLPVPLVFAAILLPILLKTVLILTAYRAIPVERFVDVDVKQEDENTDKEFLTELAVTETAVCHLITRVDQFIQNDVGHAGLESPNLVTDAQAAARQGVSMVECSGVGAGASPEAEAAEAAEAADMEHRLSRLEETLRSFTGKELQKTFDRTMKCGDESFVGSVTDDKTRRLKAIQTLLHEQQEKLLAPIDKKTEDLKKGIVSDCDKRKAATAATATPNKK